MSKFKVGDRVGRWTVRGPAFKVRSRDKVPCRCDCGTERDVFAQSLGVGSVSCGCTVRRDLSGTRFGRLVVLEKAASVDHGSRWLCACDCGGRATVRGTVLTRGECRSCGCIVRCHPTTVDDTLVHYIPEPNTGCWLWLGPVGPRGYGVTSKVVGAKRAHRFFWEHTRGPIGDGIGVLHKCDTPLCVNPAHLFLGTQKDNVADMVAKGRSAGQRKTALRELCKPRKVTA